MDRFEAFSKHGPAVAGEDGTKAFADFFLRTSPGARVEPRLLRMTLDLDAETIDDLARLGQKVGLLVRADQVRCPYSDCDMPVDLGSLDEARDRGEEAECPNCHRTIERAQSLSAAQRYALSDAAAVEAAAWQAEQGKRPTLKAVILCAIVDELQQIRALMERNGAVAESSSLDGAVYLTGDFAGAHVDWELGAAFTKQTGSQASASTAGAILSFSPQLILYVGIAGSLKGGVDLGDVVVADVVHDYEVGKEHRPEAGDAGHYQRRPLQQQSSFQLEQWAGVVKTTGAWRERIELVDAELASEPAVHIEPIAAGSKVVANKDSHTFRLIDAAAPRAVAVEMEGAGFLAAVNRFPKTDGLLIRGISDRLDDKDSSDLKGWRHQAAANAAAFAFELLHRYKPAEDRSAS